jgi:hypothetical protein
MEDSLKILKLEYHNNHLFYHTQIKILSLDDKAIFEKSLKWRWPQMENYLKLLKGEYLSIQKNEKCLDLPDQKIFQYCPPPDTCAEKIPIVLMGGWTQGQACA